MGAMNKQSDSSDLCKANSYGWKRLEQESYLKNLKARISDGYYYSDLILSDSR